MHQQWPSHLDHFWIQRHSDAEHCLALEQSVRSIRASGILPHVALRLGGRRGDKIQIQGRRAAPMAQKGTASSCSKEATGPCPRVYRSSRVSSASYGYQAQVCGGVLPSEPMCPLGLPLGCKPIRAAAILADADSDPKASQREDYQRGVRPQWQQYKNACRFTDHRKERRYIQERRTVERAACTRDAG